MAVIGGRSLERRRKELQGLQLVLRVSRRQGLGQGEAIHTEVVAGVDCSRDEALRRRTTTLGRKVTTRLRELALTARGSQNVKSRNLYVIFTPF